MKIKKYRYVLNSKAKCPFCGKVSYFGIGLSGVGCDHIMIREDKKFKVKGVLRFGRKFTFVKEEG
jgi:hypothetical protein